MAQTHSTQRPAQMETDPAIVVQEGGRFRGIVDVPRYSAPDAGANKLSDDQRNQVAVACVLAGDDGFIPNYAGMQFEVRWSMHSEWHQVDFSANPTIRAVLRAHRGDDQ